MTQRAKRREKAVGQDGERKEYSRELTVGIEQGKR